MTLKPMSFWKKFKKSNQATKQPDNFEQNTPNNITATKEQTPNPSRKYSIPDDSERAIQVKVSSTSVSKAQAETQKPISKAPGETQTNGTNGAQTKRQSGSVQLSENPEIAVIQSKSTESIFKRVYTAAKRKSQASSHRGSVASIASKTSIEQPKVAEHEKRRRSSVLPSEDLPTVEISAGMSSRKSRSVFKRIYNAATRKSVAATISKTSVAQSKEDKGRRQSSTLPSEDLLTKGIPAGASSSRTSQNSNKPTTHVGAFRRIIKALFGKSGESKPRNGKSENPSEQKNKKNLKVINNQDSSSYYDANEYRSYETSQEYYAALNFPTIVITKPSTESLPPTPAQQKVIEKRKKRKALQQAKIKNNQTKAGQK